MLLAILCLLLTYHKFWVLGRQVSFSPIEIVKAFDSRLLKYDAAMGGEVDALVKGLGPRNVRYVFEQRGAWIR